MWSLPSDASRLTQLRTACADWSVSIPCTVTSAAVATERTSTMRSSLRGTSHSGRAANRRQDSIVAALLRHHLTNRPIIDTTAQTTMAQNAAVAKSSINTQWEFGEHSVGAQSPARVRNSPNRGGGHRTLVYSKQRFDRYWSQPFLCTNRDDNF